MKYFKRSFLEWELFTVNSFVSQKAPCPHLLTHMRDLKEGTCEGFRGSNIFDGNGFVDQVGKDSQKPVAKAPIVQVSKMVFEGGIYLQRECIVVSSLAVGEREQDAVVWQGPVDAERCGVGNEKVLEFDLSPHQGKLSPHVRPTKVSMVRCFEVSYAVTPITRAVSCPPAGRLTREDSPPMQHVASQAAQG